MKEKGGKERKKKWGVRERERELYVRSYQVGLTLF